MLGHGLGKQRGDSRRLHQRSAPDLHFARAPLTSLTGSIAVFNIADALKDPRETAPTHYVVAHQSAIRALAWVRAPGVNARGERCADNPTVIASGGYDGLECITDIRDPVSNAMNRTRGISDRSRVLFSILSLMPRRAQTSSIR